MSTTALARISTLDYMVPPACQGQIVEYSYAAVPDGRGGGWWLQRCEDRSDRSVSYRYAAWPEDGTYDGVAFEPWQTEPSADWQGLDDDAARRIARYATVAR